MAGVTLKAGRGKLLQELTRGLEGGVGVSEEKGKRKRKKPHNVI